MFLRIPELRTDTTANRLFREAAEIWRCATNQLSIEFKSNVVSSVQERVEAATYKMAFLSAILLSAYKQGSF